MLEMMLRFIQFLLELKILIDELVIVGLEAESHLTSLNDYPIIKSQFESIGYQTRVF